MGDSVVHLALVRHRSVVVSVRDFPGSERDLSKENLGWNRPFTWVGPEGDCLLSFPAPACGLEIYGLNISFSRPHHRHNHGIGSSVRVCFIVRLVSG